MKVAVTTENGIVFPHFGKTPGDVEQVLADFAAGTLAFRPDFSCSHQHGHADGHDCGSHRYNN